MIGVDDDKFGGQYYYWLFFCVVGMVSSLTMYGIVLEFVTSDGRKLHEVSFVFVTTSIYAVTAYIAREMMHEKPTHIPKYQMLILSITSIISTLTSVRSLRYVIYPVQVRLYLVLIYVHVCMYMDVCRFFCSYVCMYAYLFK